MLTSDYQRSAGLSVLTPDICVQGVPEGRFTNGHFRHYLSMFIHPFHYLKCPYIRHSKHKMNIDIEFANPWLQDDGLVSFAATLKAKPRKPPVFLSEGGVSGCVNVDTGVYSMPSWLASARVIVNLRGELRSWSTS